MKDVIKVQLYNLFEGGFLKHEDFDKYWNSVQFLSKKSTDIWFNALMAHYQPEVREFYRELYNH